VLEEMFSLAHIAGVPVEETLGMFAPAATIALGVCAATMKFRWRELRGVLRANRNGRSGEGAGHVR
jgi:hypothetical protein